MEMRASWHTLSLFASLNSYQPDTANAEKARSFYVSSGLTCRVFERPLRCHVPLEAADVPEEFVSAQAIAHSLQKQGEKIVHCQV